jgi:hypothetical protein
MKNRVAFLSLVILASASAFAQSIQQRTVVAANAGFAARPTSTLARLASIRSVTDAEGSRVVITSDATLNDYRAYTEGGRFLVLIPSAVEPQAKDGLNGRGFTDAQIIKRGEDVLFSFELEAGASAHVQQRFNRLEIFFVFAGEQSATQTNALAAPSPTPQPATNSSADSTKDPAASSPATSATTPSAQKANVTPTSPVTVSGIKLPAEKANPVRIPKFEKRPVIDGKLDDEIWKTAAVLKDFYQMSPGDNTAPSKPTETLIGYDSKFIYFGFHCFDEPDKVRATIAKRDEVMNTEDSIRVLIDTFNDQRKAYVLAFNPLGVQQDGIRTEGLGADFSVDIVMESKGTLTNDGYTVEVAVPFKSLRYEAGKGKLWGLQVFRIIQRFNGEQDSWMPISRDINGLLNQEGHITGLEGISSERTLELIPSLTVSETGKLLPHYDPIPNDPGRMVNQPVKMDLGLTAKYTLTPNSTINLAINPDFAQVEADATVVTTNQRFPIFFQEKRPFFLEGIDIFQLPLNVVHTRTIIDPEVAVKLVGKSGRNSYGLMLAADNGPGNFVGDERLNSFNFPLLDKKAYDGVLRLKHDIGKESSVGFVATTYNFIERHNNIAGFDGRFKLDPQTTFTFHAVGTTSRAFFRDPELDTVTACANLVGREAQFCRSRQLYRTGNGLGYYAQYQKAGRNLFLQGTAFGRTSDFRADLGFTRRTNTNSDQFYVEYDSTPKQKARLVSWNIESLNQLNYDWKGLIQGWSSGVHSGFNFHRQGFLVVGFDNNYEKDYEEEFGAKRTVAHGGAFFGLPARSTNNKVWVFGAGITPSKKYSAQMFVNLSDGEMDFDFGGGDRFPRVSPAALQFGQGTKLDPGPGRGLDLNGTFTYQPTNELRFQLDYTKSRLRRYDTGLLAFDDNIYVLRSTYQFTRFTFARARVDYDTLASNIRGQFLLGWTPNPGTAFYVGYNDDLNRNGFNPFTGDLEPGFRRNGRTFFVKMSYLFRKSFEKKA